MVNTAPRLKTLANIVKRGVIGFVAGLIVAWFALTFLGVLHGHNDLGQLELEREYQGRWLAIYIAFGAAALATVMGKRQVSKFWLWFCIVFAAICLIPFWPHKDGSWLPLGTPYVNSGFHHGEAILLMIHVSISLAIAATIHWLWSIMRKRKAI